MYVTCFLIILTCWKLFIAFKILWNKISEILFLEHYEIEVVVSLWCLYNLKFYMIDMINTLYIRIHVSYIFYWNLLKIKCSFLFTYLHDFHYFIVCCLFVHCNHWGCCIHIIYHIKTNFTENVWITCTLKLRIMMKGSKTINNVNNDIYTFNVYFPYVCIRNLRR